MIFETKSKVPKQRNRDAGSVNEMWEVCLCPDYLVERLSGVLFEKTGQTSGHIHFHFRNNSDHIIFVWSEGKLKKIVAKSPGYRKGQHGHWKDSRFRDYNREDVLMRLYNAIECIEIDGDSFNKTWSSYSAFISWLIEN